MSKKNGVQLLSLLAFDLSGRRIENPTLRLINFEDGINFYAVEKNFYTPVFPVLGIYVKLNGTNPFFRQFSIKYVINNKVYDTDQFYKDEMTYHHESMTFSGYTYQPILYVSLQRLNEHLPVMSTFDLRADISIRYEPSSSYKARTHLFKRNFAQSINNENLYGLLWSAMFDETSITYYNRQDFVNKTSIRLPIDNVGLKYTARDNTKSITFYIRDNNLIYESDSIAVNESYVTNQYALSFLVPYFPRIGNGNVFYNSGGDLINLLQPPDKPIYVGDKLYHAQTAKFATINQIQVYGQNKYRLYLSASISGNPEYATIYSLLRRSIALRQENNWMHAWHNLTMAIGYNLPSNPIDWPVSRSITSFVLDAPIVVRYKKLAADYFVARIDGKTYTCTYNSIGTDTWEITHIHYNVIGLYAKAVAIEVEAQLDGIQRTVVSVGSNEFQILYGGILKPDSTLQYLIDHQTFKSDKPVVLQVLTQQETIVANIDGQATAIDYTEGPTPSSYYIDNIIYSQIGLKTVIFARSNGSETTEIGRLSIMFTQAIQLDLSSARYKMYMINNPFMFNTTVSFLVEPALDIQRSILHVRRKFATGLALNTPANISSYDRHTLLEFTVPFIEYGRFDAHVIVTVEDGQEIAATNLTTVAYEAEPYLKVWAWIDLGGIWGKEYWNIVISTTTPYFMFYDHASSKLLTPALTMYAEAKPYNRNSIITYTRSVELEYTDTRGILTKVSSDFSTTSIDYNLDVPIDTLVNVKLTFHATGTVNFSNRIDTGQSSRSFQVLYIKTSQRIWDHPVAALLAARGFASSVGHALIGSAPS